MVHCIIVCQASNAVNYIVSIHPVSVPHVDERPTSVNTVNMTEQVDFAKEPELTLGWRIQMALEAGGRIWTMAMSRPPRHCAERGNPRRTERRLSWRG